MQRPKYYSAKEVGEMFDRDPHIIRDWIRFGCPTPDGRVKLQGVKLGKSWVVKEEWLAVFEIQARPLHGGPGLDLE